MIQQVIMFKYSIIIFIIKFFLVNGPLIASGLTVVNKCYHEGDFIISCNKTKLPSSDDPIELMRYANVINGLQYNDTYCAHTSLTCSRKMGLKECIDQTFCAVKNGWFSLLPHCNGNSYYTQFEYDCQPAYYMCDRSTIVNAFSGLILSPGYPSSYKIDTTKTCHLTVHLPSNHYTQITIEAFHMLNSKKCSNDYLNIHEYVYVNANERNPLEGNWKQLATWCGEFGSGYKIIAKSDKISLTFRSLAAAKNANVEGFKFKLFFEAIPAIFNEAIATTSTPRNNTQIIYTQKNNVHVSQQQTEKNNKGSINMSLLSFGVGAICGLFVLLIIIVAGGILAFKKFNLGNLFKSGKQSQQVKSSDSKNNNLNDDKKPINKTNNNFKPTNNTIKSYDFDVENETENLLNSSYNSTLAGSKLSTKVDATKPVKGSIPASAREESRKMQAERPLLLQDLSQSKLLSKYKQENGVPNESSKQTEPTDSESKSQIKSPTESQISKAKTDSLVQQTSITSNSVVKSSPAKPSVENSGIYGVDMTDCGGVYGADVNTISKQCNAELNKKPSICSNSSNHETKNTENDSTSKLPFTTAESSLNADSISESKITSEKQETTEITKDGSNVPNENSKLLRFTDENLGVVSAMKDDTYQDPPSATTTPRKTAFNPLHVILKDKNKYYTTEYI